MTDKLRDYFDEMVVYKDLKNNNFFSSLGLPAFLRDYLLKMFSDDFGNFDVDEVSAFVKKFIPKKEDWMSIKNKIIYENESVQILTKISVDINIKTGEISFAIPDFGVTEKETLIEPAIWDVYKEDLINTGETWGIIKLGYRQPDDTVKPKIPGKIKLTGFKNFRPYTVDVEYFKEMRSNFETDEWIDILLGAIDYNADGYETKLQKLTMLTRLLPFVEKRINLIELAPKGTGKSYVFGHISKNGLLTDGGKVTRSKMFYDANRRKPGYICGPDYVAIDEVKLVNFGDENEMRSILQGYLEYGTFNSNGYNGESDAGVVFLGNIKVDYLPVDKQGVVSCEDLVKFIKGNTELISVMMVNNEIGTIEPIKELATVAHDNGILFHTDAVQAVGHIPIDVSDLCVDMLSASAHKFNGPKGIGFLYIKRGTKISSFADGGAQEFHKRAGTENIASIVGMSIALKKSCDEMEKVNKKLLALDEAFNDVLLKSKIDFIRNGSNNHVPGNINLSIRRTSGEMLLHRLDLMGICISTGSACDSVNTEVSHVIKAIGVPSEYSEGTIRISFGRDNTEEDAIMIAKALVKVIKG